MEEVRSWLKDLGLTSINYLLRNYSAYELTEALEDMERALAEQRPGRFKIRDRTAYFRSLLK